MTKQEFISRLEENKEVSGKNVGFGLLAFFANAVLCVCIAGWIEKMKLPEWIEAILGILTLVLMISPLFVMGWFVSRNLQKRNLLLPCPHCGRSLAGRVTAQIVIATGNCGYCGERVLEP